jgi:integrase
VSQTIGYARVSAAGGNLARVLPLRMEQTSGDEALAALERCLAPARRSVSPGTAKKYRERARAYVAWLDPTVYPDAFVDAVGARAAMLEWRRQMLGNEPKLSASYVNLSLAAVTLMYEQVRITTKVKRARVAKPGAPKALTRPEESNLRRQAERRGKRDEAIIAFLLGTGARVEECARVNVNDVTLTERTGNVRLFGKGDEVRDVPPDKLARDALRALMLEHPGAGKLWLGRRGPLTVEGITQVVRIVGRMAGLPGLRPHRLRHTYATRQREEGLDIAQIQALLGHVSIETTARYFRASAAELQAAVDRRWAVDEA